MKNIFISFSLITFLSSAFAVAQTSLSTHDLIFKNNTLVLQAQFISGPTTGAESQMSLEAKDIATQKSFDLQDQVEVVLWMPSMGHGSAPTRVEKLSDAEGNIVPGAFIVKRIFFIMPGDWQVRVTLTDSNGIKETQIFDLLL